MSSPDSTRDLLPIEALPDDVIEEAMAGTGFPPEHPNLPFVANAVYRARLAETAHIDDVTGLPNRSYMRFVGDAVLKTVGGSREYHPTGAIGFLIDLKDFGEDINNIYGHPQGDETLENTGTILPRVVRADMGDLVGRWGGDEFSMLVVNRSDKRSDTELARTIGKRLINIPFTEPTQPKQLRFRRAIFRPGMTMKDLMAEADMKGPKKALAVYSRVNPSYFVSNRPV